jgi:hypothetical protein
MGWRKSTAFNLKERGDPACGMVVSRKEWLYDRFSLFAALLLIAIGLAYFSPANAAGQGGIMTQTDKTLWQVIEALIQQIPFTRQKVETALAIQFPDANKDTNFDIFENQGTPLLLADGVVISDVDLWIKRIVRHPGSLTLKIGGACVTKDQLKTHYDQLKITSYPTGVSLEEATMYTQDMPWGRLSFGFKEQNPDCLAVIHFVPRDDIVKDIVTQTDRTLWQVIDALIQQIPFTRKKVETVLAIQLIDTQQTVNPFFDFYESPAVIHLAEGVVISEVDLRIKREGPHPGILHLEIGGICITIDQLEARYGTLKIISTPTGHSLEESFTYAPDLPWGKLYFGFKERNPDCLSGVGFAPKKD